MSHKQAKRQRQEDRRKELRERQRLTRVGSWSHRRKLAWAEGHIEDVEALVAGWARDGYRIHEQTNSEGRIELCGELLKPLPDELPLVMSDAVQCLRQSLDHIVFALSRPPIGTMTLQDEDVPQFPIYDGPVQPGKGRIRFCPTDAQDDICELAPNPDREPLNSHPLWLLNKLSNRDKHRELQLVAISSAITEFALLASDGSDYFHLIGPQRLELRARSMPFVEFTRSPNVHAQMRCSTDVQFDQGSEVQNRVVVATLRWFHDHIRDTVFKRLEPHL